MKNKKILAINIGSSSKKYAFYDGGKKIFDLHLEKDKNGYVSSLNFEKQITKKRISKKEYDTILEKIISDNKVDVYGIRIVAPGKYFLEHRKIDKKYLLELKKSQEIAPLHIDYIISEIKQIQTLVKNPIIIGVSDSAFHQTMPDKAKLYSISNKDLKKYDILRFGYHGISISSALDKIKLLYKKIPQRIIICHLGSGASISALKNGKSIENSMGFTPLEGIPMSTRVGNIDVGAALYLIQKNNLSYNQARDYFYHKCGLLGYSGTTNDIRELLQLEKKGDQKAKLALETFVYHIQKYIGAYYVALGGIDLLVFTATIGERSWVIRERVCSNLQCLGIEIDKQKNLKTIEQDNFINKITSKTDILVLKTDEMSIIEKITNNKILENFKLSIKN